MEGPSSRCGEEGDSTWDCVEGSRIRGGHGGGAGWGTAEIFHRESPDSA